MADINIHTDSQPSRPTWLVVLTIAAMWIAVVGLILVPARQSGWTLGWIYLGLFAAGSGISKACLLIWNLGLLRRRQRIGSGTKAWDKVWLAVFLTNMFTLLVVAVYEFDMRASDLDSSKIEIVSERSTETWSDSVRILRKVFLCIRQPTQETRVVSIFA